MRATRIITTTLLLLTLALTVATPSIKNQDPNGNTVAPVKMHQDMTPDPQQLRQDLRDVEKLESLLLRHERAAAGGDRLAVARVDGIVGAMLAAEMTGPERRDRGYYASIRSEWQQHGVEDDLGRKTVLLRQLIGLARGERPDLDQSP